jgi:hypothetical protein
LLVGALGGDEPLNEKVVYDMGNRFAPIGGGGETSSLGLGKPQVVKNEFTDFLHRHFVAGINFYGNFSVSHILSLFCCLRD